MWAGIGVAGLAGAAPAAADRYEATVVVRPMGALARVSEPVGMAENAGGNASSRGTSVYGGGLGVGLSYGLRNWLDVGVELDAAGLARATYDPASVSISNNPFTGRLERTTRTAQLRVGATLRLGVAWVPVLYLGAGLGARQRTDATIFVDGDARRFTPDDMDASLSLDLVTAVRAGIEHRLDRRWTVGVDAGVSHAVGVGAPSLDTASVNLSLAYTWYPAFAP